MPGLPPAGRSGANRWRRRSGRRTGTGTTGAGRSPASATRRPGWRSSAWLPRPTAPTAPAACSPATARVTSSSPPSTAPVSPTSPTSEHRHDGLVLTGAWITAPVRCAPPANKPTPAERDTCRPLLERGAGAPAEPAGLRRPRAVRLPGLAAPPGCHAPAEVRPRHRGATPRRQDDPLQLPRQPTEHLHRPADRAHARPRLRHAPEISWPGRPMARKRPDCPVGQRVVQETERQRARPCGSARNRRQGSEVRENPVGGSRGSPKGRCAPCPVVIRSGVAGRATRVRCGHRAPGQEPRRAQATTNPPARRGPGRRRIGPDPRSGRSLGPHR